MISQIRKHWPALQFIRRRRTLQRTCFAVVGEGILLFILYQLLFHAKLGRSANLLALSGGLLFLIVAPVFTSSLLGKYAEFLSSPGFSLLPASARLRAWGTILLGGQLYSLCFVALAALTLLFWAPVVSSVSHLQVGLLHVVFVVYIFTGTAMTAFWWRVCRHGVFATGLTYLVWSALIGGVFFLRPLDRYLDNLQPIIPPFLHLNPLVAVCHILQTDVFRTPHLYELTPLTSYLFVYPSWVVICGWQIAIGAGCLMIALRRV